MRKPGLPTLNWSAAFLGASTEVAFVTLLMLVFAMIASLVNWGV